MQARPGDVIIRKRGGTSLAQWGTVTDYGAEPSQWAAGTASEAESAAAQVVAATKGIVWHQDEAPDGPGNAIVKASTGR